MTLGMMMSLTYIIGQVAAPVLEFIGFAQTYQDAKISLEKLNDVHSLKDEEYDIKSKSTELPSSCNIVFDHVSFSYSGSERDLALKDISLVIPENKVTAIVGSSGSGKTTLVKLIQGFYLPYSGTLLIGDIPIHKINPHVWRSKTGSVMQDSYILSDTIARNIALGDKEVDYDKLRHAVQVANIENFIKSLPLGFETKISMEGTDISQGQRQRILIARAVYKNPEFLFIDEATNALNANNEKCIIDSMKEFYKGKTVLIAAHRLSTVKDADNIIVLENGRIIEQGCHEFLLAKHGAYYNLVKNQLELAK